MPKDINELRKHYAGLAFEQKKEFIMDLKKNSPEHKRLLEECITDYNEEVRARNKAAGFAPKPKQMPDITSDTFARALAVLIQGGAKSSGISVKSKLIGKWQREPDEGDYFYKFNDDGSFETNEFDGEANSPDGLLIGKYTVGIDNVVLMEPHEKLRFRSLMFSQTGNSLIIGLKDGLMIEYKRGV
jgi:hypothetical protein